MRSWKRKEQEEKQECKVQGWVESAVLMLDQFGGRRWNFKGKPSHKHHPPVNIRAGLH